MTVPVILVTLLLANWRISSFIAREEGPWDFMVKLRHLAGVRYDEHSQPYGENEVATMILCLWCNSIWLGLFSLALFYFLPTLAFYLSLPFALSAGVVILEEQIR